jgi:hypothetical protein
MKSFLILFCFFIAQKAVYAFDPNLCLKNISTYSKRMELADQNQRLKNVVPQLIKISEGRVVNKFNLELYYHGISSVQARTNLISYSSALFTYAAQTSKSESDMNELRNLFKGLHTNISISYDLNDIFLNKLKSSENEYADARITALLKDVSQVIREINSSLLPCRS